MSSSQTSPQSAEQALLALEELLKEWKSITESERRSLDSDDWSSLEDLQERKGHFQRLISDAEGCLFSGEMLSSDRKAIEKERLRRWIEELVRMESDNGELLARKLSFADSQLKHSEKAIRSLRHIQQAYGVGRRSFWHAYS